jgi:hypothetical protein
MAPIRELPVEYQETLHYQLTNRRTLFWLNVAALVPLLLGVVWMGIWWSLVNPLRVGQMEGQTAIPWWLGTVLVFIVVLPLHELIHGLAIQLCGHQAHYGMKLNLGVLYATADQALFRRNEYILIALAPLVVITLIGLALVIILPASLGYYVSIGVALNAGGAIGDLWSVVILLRYPARALVRDEGDGFRIYTA